MCLGNRAENSVQFINSQLGALYENAIHCTSKHGTGLKPTLSEVEYSTCLYEFYGPGRHSRHQPSSRDLAFFARFGRPRLEFVCNHEVVLFLDIKNGHFNLDTTKAFTKRGPYETIKNWTVAFRITFSTHAIEKFRCPSVGNVEDYTIILHVLDMKSAVFEFDHSNLPGLPSTDDDARKRKLSALTHYLIGSYLPTIKSAGHHVLYSLPDFDKLESTSAHIDYSVINKRTLTTDTLFGVNIADINTFLRGLWLQAAAFIDEHGLSPDTISKTSLAELKTPADGIDGVHMHLFFGPLHVQPLCRREVILYLDIQDMHVYLDGDFNGGPAHKLEDWKIALIVDVTSEETDEGSSMRVRLDLNTARFCEHLSVMGNYHDEKVLRRIKATLTRYITTYYLNVLETSETTVIYHYDKRIHMQASESDIDDEGEDASAEDNFHVNDCTCTDVTACGHEGGVRWGIITKRVITHTQTADFDVVTAMTQGSINAHFKALWDLARRRSELSATFKPSESPDLETVTCLAEFSVTHVDSDEAFFSSSFDAPKVQLVCKEGSYSVILYLHLADGYLKTLGPEKSLQPEAEPYTFSNWRLAFEVDLKLVDATNESVADVVLKRLNSLRPSAVKQLILDLSTARFSVPLSTIPGLLGGTDYRNIRARREALIYYIQTYYFPVFMCAHHHVLYTIPLLGQTSPGPQFQRLTSLKFQILPFNYGHGTKYLEGLYGAHRSIFERNMIVIMGTLDGRQLPAHTLPRDTNWVSGLGKDIPFGTVCLSRKVFLESRLLSLLERINRDTTVVPTFSGVSDGEWLLKLTTWGKHEMKKNYPCKWREVTTCGDSLDFEWKNCDEWRYKNEGDFDGNGHYTVTCMTRNNVFIPTDGIAPSVITIRGSVDLGLSYEGRNKDWGSRATVSWSADIKFTSDTSGLRVQLTSPRIIPKIDSPFKNQGLLGNSTHEMVLSNLKDEFPAIIDFDGLVKELRCGFEGAWTGLQLSSQELKVGSPVFNRRGDLLLELDVRPPHADTVSIVNAGRLSKMSRNSTGETRIASPLRGNSNLIQSVVSSPLVRTHGASFSRMTSTRTTVIQQVVTKESSTEDNSDGSGSESSGEDITADDI
ncbi:hypothetical protein M0805_003206 [Coniferiporia weirii]|nr:hypothetical protein M0805_003206 [Coniferiporia weirii]